MSPRSFRPPRFLPASSGTGAAVLVLLLAGLPSAQAQTATPALVPPVQATQPADPGNAKGGYVLPEPGAPRAAPPASAAPPPPPSPEAQETLRLVNAYRAAGATCGSQRYEPAPPLAWSAALEQAALKHARDMAARRDMSHTGGDGSSMSQRVGREGYAWSALGENVSAGYRSIADGLRGWMQSPGHCRNMMGAQFREIGVGAAFTSGDSFGWYRAMVLGTPR